MLQELVLPHRGVARRWLADQCADLDDDSHHGFPLHQRRFLLPQDDRRGAAYPESWNTDYFRDVARLGVLPDVDHQGAACPVNSNRGYFPDAVPVGAVAEESHSGSEHLTESQA